MILSTATIFFAKVFPPIYKLLKIRKILTERSNNFFLIYNTIILLMVVPFSETLLIEVPCLYFDFFGSFK